MTQLGCLGLALEPLLLAQRALPVQQDAEPLGVAKGGTLRIVRQVAEAFGHAV